MRSKAEVLRRVSIVVADEFHLLNDSHRGPTMEITKNQTFIARCSNYYSICYSRNSQDLADWLDSDLVVSEWRPVSLEYATLAELDLEPRAIQKSEFSSTTNLGHQGL